MALEIWEGIRVQVQPLGHKQLAELSGKYKNGE